MTARMPNRLPAAELLDSRHGVSGGAPEAKRSSAAPLRVITTLQVLGHSGVPLPRLDRADPPVAVDSRPPRGRHHLPVISTRVFGPASAMLTATAFRIHPAGTGHASTRDCWSLRGWWIFGRHRRGVPCSRTYVTPLGAAGHIFNPVDFGLVLSCSCSGAPRRPLDFCGARCRRGSASPSSVIVHRRASSSSRAPLLWIASPLLSLSARESRLAADATRLPRAGSSDRSCGWTSGGCS